MLQLRDIKWFWSIPFKFCKDLRTREVRGSILLLAFETKRVVFLIFFLVMKAFKIYSLSYFHICNTILLTIDAMLHMNFKIMLHHFPKSMDYSWMGRYNFLKCLQLSCSTGSIDVKMQSSITICGQTDGTDSVWFRPEQPNRTFYSEGSVLYIYRIVIWTHALHFCNLCELVS